MYLDRQTLHLLTDVSTALRRTPFPDVKGLMYISEQTTETLVIGITLDVDVI